jgi:hypothetical protein
VNCPGLHCSGCGDHGNGGGRTVLVAAAAVAVIEAAEYVIDRVWWILSGTAVFVGVPVLVAWQLMRWQRRREDSHMREHPFVIDRDAHRAVGSSRRGAVGGDLHIHFHALTADEQAAIIRQALTRDS